MPDAGLNASISPLILSGTSGSANVTTVSTASGNYTLIVEATSGSYSQRLYLFVTVLPNAVPANPFDPLVLTVIAILAMVIVAAMLLSRRRKVKKKRKSRP